MTVAQRELPSKVNENATSLAREWRRLGRAATAVALLTSPAVLVLFHNRYGWPWIWSLLGAIAVVVVFRAIVDIVAHRLIPTPSLYGTGSRAARGGRHLAAAAVVLEAQAAHRARWSARCC